jgi:hypothetical protein
LDGFPSAALAMPTPGNCQVNAKIAAIAAATISFPDMLGNPVSRERKFILPISHKAMAILLLFVFAVIRPREACLSPMDFTSR